MLIPDAIILRVRRQLLVAVAPMLRQQRKKTKRMMRTVTTQKTIVRTRNSFFAIVSIPMANQRKT